MTWEDGTVPTLKKKPGIVPHLQSQHWQVIPGILQLISLVPMTNSRPMRDSISKGKYRWHLGNDTWGPPPTFPPTYMYMNPHANVGAHGEKWGGRKHRIELLCQLLLEHNHGCPKAVSNGSSWSSLWLIYNWPQNTHLWLTIAHGCTPLRIRTASAGEELLTRGPRSTKCV